MITFVFEVLILFIFLYFSPFLYVSHWASLDTLLLPVREDIEKRNRAKMDENRMELEKVKKRRQERELERQEREKIMELEQRQREAAQFNQFSRQEDQFQLEQAR